MLTVLAIGAAKLTKTLVSTLHIGSGTSLPGQIARRLDPQVLARLSAQITGETLAVTGTNGKTTTCGLVADLLAHRRSPVVHNQLGANMVSGITAALIHQTNPQGSLTAKQGILEVDEASLERVSREATIHRLVVTNLFRDQLDRYGELDTTARMIAKGFPSVKIQLILNADDPLVAGLGEKDEAKTLEQRSQCAPLYYGIDAITYEYPITWPEGSVVPFQRESTACPLCQSILHYDVEFYGHLGHYHCPGCQYRRPTPQLRVTHLQVSPSGSVMDLHFDPTGQHWRLSCPLPGVFNAYNVLAALAGALATEPDGWTEETLQEILNHYHGVFGRAERRQLSDPNGVAKSIMVLLIKNPTGASEVLKLVAGDPKGRLCIAINDHYADGRDISWLWDAAFECIPREKAIVVSGRRAWDMATRLKYAGVPEEKLQVIPDFFQALDQGLLNTAPDETLYVLPTYTVLLQYKDRFCTP